MFSCLLDQLNSSHVNLSFSCFFFFTDTAPTEIYTLSLHDALPISRRRRTRGCGRSGCGLSGPTDPDLLLRRSHALGLRDRKSTRLNSSHSSISYAVFCLKKKNIDDCSRVVPKLDIGLNRHSYAAVS